MCHRCFESDYMMAARAQADLAVTFVMPAGQEFRSLQGCMTSTTGPLSTAGLCELTEKNLISRDSFSNSKTPNHVYKYVM